MDSTAPADAETTVMDIAQRSTTAADTRLAEAAKLLRAGRPADALAHLETAASAASAVGPAHSLHLQTLVTLGRRREALEALSHALSLPAPTADALDALAFHARQLDRHELSNSLYRRAAEAAPEDAQLWYNFATSERTLGRLGSAAAACDRALQLDPQLRAAVLLRSEVTRATPAANHLADLRARIAGSPHGQDAMFLHYALGKELHELGAYDEAFQAFAAGAAARRAQLQYDVAVDERKLARIAEAFPTGSPAAAPDSEAQHIFIVGLPRSGTTLTERILGALPGVTSNNETDNFSTALLRAAPATGGDVFARAALADPTDVAREYDALARPDEPSLRIIEKLPFNFLYVGAILRAFPGTPIIWLRRHPLDACFAMFRTLFGAAYPFSYDFQELARYYAAYERLMDHWAAIYPGQISFVDYERLVERPQTVGAELAARCGLPWSEDALDLSRNPAASLTASAAQVREGIYSSSVGVWRRYARRLEPLAEHLRAQGVVVDLS